MKELIEKINSYNFDNLESVEDFYQIEEFKQAILQDLEKIQEQESKEFNPVEILKFDGMVSYENKEKTFFMQHIIDNLWHVCFSVPKMSEYQTSYSEVKFNIKIPNHRFGVELLKNLGVIE